MPTDPASSRNLKPPALAGGVFTQLQQGPFTQAWIFCLLVYVGFETTRNLAGETRAARTATPKVKLVSVDMAGLFFVAMAYIEILAFAHIPGAIGKVPAPLNRISEAIARPWQRIYSDLAMPAAAFLATIATLNSISRILFSMVGHQVISQYLHFRRPSHGTPTRAMGLLAVLVLFSILVLSLDIFPFCPWSGLLAHLPDWLFC